MSSESLLDNYVLRGLYASCLHGAGLLGLQGADFEVGEDAMGHTEIPVCLKRVFDIYGKVRILVVASVWIFFCGVIGRRATVNPQDSVSADLPKAKSRSAICETEAAVGPVAGVCNCGGLTGNPTLWAVFSGSR